MRSKDQGLMQKIKDFCEEYYLLHNQSPSCIRIGEEFGITRNTAYRYLVEMREKGMIDYENGSIHTEKTNKVNAEFSSAALVGSIPCGTPEEEFEEIQEIVQLPVSVFGKGEFYLLRASGESMIDVGICDGDLLVIRKQSTAVDGDIVVALTPDNTNTLKTIYFDKENHEVVLHPENKSMSDMHYPSCTIQGVLKFVIKDVEGIKKRR
ncbi:MAG: repressor LexA [Eubacterium sp.]|nr:repressor LexA [Eubacterium sp.]